MTLKLWILNIPDVTQNLAFRAARKFSRIEDRKRPNIKSIWSRLRSSIREVLAPSKCQLLSHVRYIFLLGFLLTGCCCKIPLVIQREINIPYDLDIISQDYLLDGAVLSLEDIIAIAMERNFDLLIKQREWDIQNEVVKQDYLKLLPALIANGELSHRNNPLIVSSESVVCNVPPAPPSISTQQDVARYDINIVMGLLDYGLSYFKTMQDCNRTIMLAFEYERVRQNLIVSIAKQYWTAIAAKLAIDQGREILIKARQHEKDIENEIDEKIISKIAGLQQAINLIDIQMLTEGYNSVYFPEGYLQSYHNAISNLALLMGISPNVNFTLAYDGNRAIDELYEDIYTLEEIALRNRPELYARDAEERVAEDEARAAFFKMVPGIELFAGNFYDNNKFFTFHHWLIAGARATWNLFALPSLYYGGRVAEKQTDLVRLQRMSISVAVLSQVHLAHVLYQDNLRQYLIAHDLETAHQELIVSALDSLALGFMSELEFLNIYTQALIAKINALKFYGDLQVSLEQLNNAIGIPFYYQTPDPSLTEYSRGTADTCQVD